MLDSKMFNKYNIQDENLQNLWQLIHIHKLTITELKNTQYQVKEQ